VRLHGLSMSEVFEYVCVWCVFVVCLMSLYLCCGVFMVFVEMCDCLCECEFCLYSGFVCYECEVCRLFVCCLC